MGFESRRGAGLAADRPYVIPLMRPPTDTSAAAADPKRMICLHMSLLSVLLLMSGCDGRSPTRLSGWQPVAAGPVLTRNFMVPVSPSDSGDRLLPRTYRLGSKAYAKQPPDWWLKIVKDNGIDDRWHPNDFPLAYAGQLQSGNGGPVLLVVQVSHAFTGDGFYSPGPVIYLVARLFAPQQGGRFKLLKEESYALGDMQYSRLLAGEARGRHIEFRIEGGKGFDSNEKAFTQTWTLTMNEDNSLKMAHGESEVRESSSTNSTSKPAG